MCENSEKTVQLEGYTHKQCGHGYCWNHSPEWDHCKATKKKEEHPATKQEIWRWFWQQFWLFLTERGGRGGFVVSLCRTIAYYHKKRYHCGQKTILMMETVTQNYVCKKCGHLIEYKNNMINIKSYCPCCGYRL
jgi:hypothetical protein